MKFAIFEASLGLLGVLLIFLFGDFGTLRWNLASGQFMQAFILTLPLLAIPMLFSIKAIRRLRPIRDMYQIVEETLGPVIRECRSWHLFALSIAAGIGEELLFRGFLQAEVGIVIASLVFGLVHFITKTYFVIATLMGAYLGFVYQESGNILIPIFIHGFYDFFALLFMKKKWFKKPTEISQS